MDEQEAYDVLPLLMSDPAKGFLMGATRLASNNPRRVRNWPTAIHHLLKFYAKDYHILYTLNSFGICESAIIA